MMLAATLLAGVGYIFSLGSTATQLFLWYLGVISIAFTAGFVHAPTVVANSWFIGLRARAMTVVSAAVPVGGAIITPLLAIAVTGCWDGAGELFWPESSFWSPGSRYVWAYGARPKAWVWNRRRAASASKTRRRISSKLDPMSRTSTPARHADADFWILIVAMMARSATFTTVTTHFISHNGLES